MFTASWKVTESRQVRVITQKSERLYLSFIGDEKNRGEWKKGHVLRHIRGRDEVVRGVGLLHKGNQIQWPLQVECPLKIQRPHEGNTEELAETRVQGRTIERRRAAVDARAKNQIDYCR